MKCLECLSSNHFDHCLACTWRERTEMEEGRKDDQQKLRFDLVPPDALTELVRVYTFGAGKYDDRNWEQGIKYGRVYAAAQRHLNAWLGGEEKDSESGIHHLAHAAWNCMSLLAYELRGMKDFDDRPGLKTSCPPHSWLCRPDGYQECLHCGKLSRGFALGGLGEK